MQLPSCLQLLLQPCQPWRLQCSSRLHIRHSTAGHEHGLLLLLLLLQLLLLLLQLLLQLLRLLLQLLRLLLRRNIPWASHQARSSTRTQAQQDTC